MVIILLLQHKENEDQGGFMNALSDEAIFHFEVCSRLTERKQLRVPKNKYNMLKLKNDALTSIHIVSYIYY